MTRNSTVKSNIVQLSIGIMFCIIGVSLGGIVKLIFHINFSWISTVIIALSLFFMLDKNRIFQFKYRKPTGIIWAVFIYSAVMIVFALLSNLDSWGNPYGAVTQIVYFAQIILLWDRGIDIDSRNIIKVLLVTMSIGTLLSFFFLLQNGTTTGYLTFNILLESMENTGSVSRITMGAIGYIGFIVGLAYQPEGMKDTILKASCLIFGIAVLGLAARRSVYLALILTLVLHVKNIGIKKNVFLRKRFFKVITVGTFLIIVLLIMYLNNQTIYEMTNRAVDTLYKGVETFLGINNSDLAASYRREWIDTIPHKYFNQSTWYQFVFGRGYMTDWLDIPFMQAFWDFGLVGGIFYFVVMGIVVCRHLFVPTKCEALMFAQYYLALGFIESFANGAPYGRFFSLVLVLVLEKNEKNRAEKGEKF